MNNPFNRLEKLISDTKKLTKNNQIKLNNNNKNINRKENTNKYNNNDFQINYIHNRKKSYKKIVNESNWNSYLKEKSYSKYRINPSPQRINEQNRSKRILEPKMQEKLTYKKSVNSTAWSKSMTKNNWDFRKQQDKSNLDDYNKLRDKSIKKRKKIIDHYMKNKECWNKETNQLLDELKFKNIDFANEKIEKIYNKNNDYLKTEKIKYEEIEDPNLNEMKEKMNKQKELLKEKESNELFWGKYKYNNKKVPKSPKHIFEKNHNSDIFFLKEKNINYKLNNCKNSTPIKEKSNKNLEENNKKTLNEINKNNEYNKIKSKNSKNFREEALKEFNNNKNLNKVNKENYNSKRSNYEKINFDNFKSYKTNNSMNFYKTLYQS